jgi:hypothetical protein
MIPKGVENADAIVAACQATLAALEQPEADWKETLESIVSALEVLKTKFFLKTNLAVPATNLCRKDAVELQALAEKKELATFGEVLARFRANAEKLFGQSNMEGIVIT